ncbi:MAG: hypothetical protein ACK56F_22000, partial [bacterium]
LEGRGTIPAGREGGPVERTRGLGGSRSPGNGEATREFAGGPGCGPQRPGGADRTPASGGARAATH